MKREQMFSFAWCKAYNDHTEKMKTSFMSLGAIHVIYFVCSEILIYIYDLEYLYFKKARNIEKSMGVEK